MMDFNPMKSTIRELIISKWTLWTTTLMLIIGNITIRVRVGFKINPKTTLKVDKWMIQRVIVNYLTELIIMTWSSKRDKYLIQIQIWRSQSKMSLY
jgi:hypothetical protein